MSRYSAHELDEMEAARRRHAQREAEEWEEDRRETERQWRESEARRAREHRKGFESRRGQWEFRPIHGEGPSTGTMPGWNVVLDGIEVGLIVQTPRGELVVFSKGEPGELLAHRLHAVGTDDILAAFEAHSQRRLEAGR